MLAISAYQLSPRSFFQYFLVGLGLFIASQHSEYRLIGPYISLIGVILHLFCRNAVSEIYFRNIRDTKKGDLTDIMVRVSKANDGEDVYEPSGPDAFWVVEEVLPDGRFGEIVGFAGLGTYFPQ
jgi:hypothetical protein